MCDEFNGQSHTCSLLLIQEGICSMYWEPLGSPDPAAPTCHNVDHCPGKENGDQCRDARPAFQVARRNARERRRVQAVNAAFNRLHNAVPAEFQSRFSSEESLAPCGESARSAKRVSKVTTLRRAIEYIRLLQNIVVTRDDEF